MLNQSSSPQTCFLILAQGFNDFLTYLDLFDLAVDLLSLEELDVCFQLASFHPEYCFEGLDHSDPANQSNRSPYPLIHILRCKDVRLAVEQHPDTKTIPEQNIALLRSLYGQQKDLKGP